MDVSGITSLATSLSDMELNNAVSTKVLKTSLGIEKSTAEQLLNAIPPLPANPAVGRNINTTA